MRLFLYTTFKRISRGLCSICGDLSILRILSEIPKAGSMGNAFQTWSETTAVEFLKQHLAAQAIATDLASGIAQALTPLFYKPPRSRPGVMQLMVGNWVIRAEDLKAIELVSPVIVVGYAAAAMPSAATTTAAIATSIVTVLRVIRQLYRYGVVLKDHELKLYAAVRSSSKGLTEEQLHQRLAYGIDLNAEELFPDIASVKDGLMRLSSIHMRSGVLALVVQSKDGL